MIRKILGFVLWFTAVSPVLWAYDGSEPARLYRARKMGVPPPELREEERRDRGPSGVIQTKWETGPEFFYSRYDEQNSFHYQGWNYGLFGNAAFHYRNMYMFKLDGRLAYSQVSEDTVRGGTSEEATNWQVEFRGVFGLDFPMDPRLPLDERSFNFTPYFGAGWRWLMNDSGGKINSLGFNGINSEVSYFYLPLGMDFLFKLDPKWSLKLNFEYDIFISGEETLHLEDLGVGFDKLDLAQGTGYGARGSIRLIRKIRDYDIFIEPFIRYWSVQQSEGVDLTVGGNPFVIGNTFFFTFVPPNHTFDLGLSLGVTF